MSPDRPARRNRQNPAKSEIASGALRLRFVAPDTWRWSDPRVPRLEQRCSVQREMALAMT